MKIINAKVYTEEGIFEKKDVYTDGELISGKSGDDEVLDAEGCYLIPGLTDIHFHGCVGHDFCDGTHESIGQWQCMRHLRELPPLFRQP